MAAIAEPTVAEPAFDLTDDRLAGRNAVVLAVAAMEAVPLVLVATGLLPLKVTVSPLAGAV